MEKSILKWSGNYFHSVPPVWLQISRTPIQVEIKNTSQCEAWSAAARSSFLFYFLFSPTQAAYLRSVKDLMLMSVNKA